MFLCPLGLRKINIPIKKKMVMETSKLKKNSQTRLKAFDTGVVFQTYSFRDISQKKHFLTWYISEQEVRGSCDKNKKCNSRQVWWQDLMIWLSCSTPVVEMQLLSQQVINPNRESVLEAFPSYPFVRVPPCVQCTNHQVYTSTGDGMEWKCWARTSLYTTLNFYGQEAWWWKKSSW